jgi:hypothetical protein
MASCHPSSFTMAFDSCGVIGVAQLLEYVGSIHIFLGPYRGNPISIYLRRTENGCQVGPRIYPWNEVIGRGETPNKAAADFEDKWKSRGMAPDMYDGPNWEGGIKPERPAPPKPAASPKPAGTPGATGGAPAANAGKSSAAPSPSSESPPSESTRAQAAAASKNEPTS